MEFTNTNPAPQRHLGNVALVVLLHAALVYGLVHGLHSGQLQLADPPPLTVTTVKEPPRPEPPVTKLEPKQTKSPAMPAVDLPTPTSRDTPIDRPSLDPATPHLTEAAGEPAGLGNTAVPLAQTTPLTASAACSNYLEIRDLLADKLPLIAMRADFDTRGIQRFDMVAELTVGAAGEISSPHIIQSSNAYASRAMESSVLSSLRKLKCAGQGSTRSVQVPLTFSLLD
ncbi:hypothetical protein [Chitinimonas sp.]|uniref:hypothetical protein n=1 Tax=Chitinimonas sp. TaxID=1934313 RepID=UPI002F91C6E2